MFFINLSLFLAVLLIVLILYLLSCRQKLFLEKQKTDVAENDSRTFEEMVQRFQGIIYEHELSGRIGFISNGIERILGLNAEALKGTSFKMILDPEFQPNWDNYIQQIFKEQQSSGYFKILDNNGNPILLEYRAEAILDNGVVTGARGSALEVNEAVQSSEQAKPVINMETRTNLKPSEEMKNEHYNIVHDLKNIFAAILGFGEMLRDDKPDARDNERCVSEILTASNKGTQLIKKLLNDYSGITDSPKTQSGRHVNKPLETVKPKDLKKGQGRILFVEDEKSLLKMYTKFLIKLGYSVDSYEHAETALSEFLSKKKTYDLIITDWLMPKMSGASFVKKIRKDAQEIPIIVLSGKAVGNTAKAGVFSVLEKPVDPVQLSEVIALALQRH